MEGAIGLLVVTKRSKPYEVLLACYAEFSEIIVLNMIYLLRFVKKDLHDLTPALNDFFTWMLARE